MFKKQIPSEKLAVFERRIRWLRDGVTFAKATIAQIGEPLNSKHIGIRKKISTDLEHYDNKFNQLNNKGKFLVIAVAAVILYALLRLV